MNAEELLKTFRQRADDRVIPYLADDATVWQWASEAEREACVRARLIWDETSNFLSIPVVANQAVYPLDAHIDRIDRVTFVPTTGRQFDLILTGIDKIQSPRGDHLYTGWNWNTGYGGCSDWQTRVGRPEYAVQLENTLRLWPMPADNYAGGTLRIACYRYPLCDLKKKGDTPEIDPFLHDGLIDWMLYRFYMTHDEEMEQGVRAATALQMFNARFGERPSADVLRRHRERRRVTTRYGGL